MMGWIRDLVSRYRTAVLMLLHEPVIQPSYNVLTQHYAFLRKKKEKKEKRLLLFRRQQHLLWH